MHADIPLTRGVLGRAAALLDAEALEAARVKLGSERDFGRLGVLVILTISLVVGNSHFLSVLYLQHCCSVLNRFRHDCKLLGECILAHDEIKSTFVSPGAPR